MDITATITDAVWTKGHKGLHVCGVDSRDGGQTITSPIVAIDRDRQLARTESGSVYHVPGPRPDLDLPALRAWLLAELDAARAVVGGAK